MYRLRKVGKDERKFLGVLGGISKYIDPTADPVMLRILFILLACFSPILIVFYFVLAICLKTEGFEITKKYPVLDEDIIAEREEKIKEAADAERADEAKIVEDEMEDEQNEKED